MVAGLSPFLLPGFFLLGLVVGAVSGLFGIGGGLLLTPMLSLIFGFPFNLAVGTGISVTLGTSLVGLVRHGRLGHVEPALGLFTALGAIPGVEAGVRMVEALKIFGAVRALGGEVSGVDFVLSLIFFFVLGILGLVVFRESRSSLNKGCKEAEPIRLLLRIARCLPLPPFVELTQGELKRASVWSLLGIGAVAGFAAGLMGVGGGFLLVPMMIYLLGMPTKVAVGTSLLQVVFGSALGSALHALRGNVVLQPALVVLSGSIFGVQVGVALIKRLPGARVRLWFSMLLFVVAFSVLFKLLARMVGVI